MLSSTHETITNIIGNSEWACTTLTMADVIAPIANCMDPSNAAALPVNLVNGARAKAVAFGMVNPWPHKKRKIMTINGISPNQP